MNRVRTPRRRCLKDFSMIVIAALLSMFLLGGCQQPMLKATPFAGGEYERSAGDDFEKEAADAKDRVNLWPLAYYRKPALSVLWPIGEYSPEGWALRPLIASYDNHNKLDLLYPFGHVNKKDQSGFFWPLIWWSKTYVGSLFMGAFFEDTETEGHSGFWTPLIGAAKWTPPTRKNTPPEPKGDYGWFYSPAYAQINYPDSNAKILPWALTYWGKDGPESTFFSPLYSQINNEATEESQSTLWPLLTSWGKSGKNTSWFCSPLYHQKKVGDAKSWLMPPLLTAYKSDGNKGHFYSPLYMSKHKPSKKWKAIPPLGLAWGTHKRDGDWVRSLFYMSTDSEKSSWKSLPLLGLSWGTDGQKRTWYVNPLAGRVHRGDSTTYLSPLLLSWMTSNPKEESSSGNFLLGAIGYKYSPSVSSERFWPLYVRSVREESGQLVVFPYRTKWKEDGSSESSIFPIANWGYNAKNESSWYQSVFGIAKVSKTPNRSSSHIFPLYSATTFKSLDPKYSQGRLEGNLGLFLYSSAYEEETKNYANRYLFGFGGSQDRPGQLSSSYLFPLYSYEHEINKVEGQPAGSSTNTEFSFLSILFDYKHQARPQQEDYSRTRVLWRLWHDEQLGDQRDIDVFPFVSIHSKGDEEFSWSWLHKFIRYERNGKEKALNLLFLPAIRWGG